MVTEPLVANPPASDRMDPPRPRPRGKLYDAIAIAALLALFPVVHDVKSMLTAPYFLDEAWVALSVRFPISELPVVTASTPLGWSFLLRLVPGPDYLRVVPLAFHLVCIVGAYALGRQLSWRTPGLGRLAGVVCAAAVLLLPLQQVRHDLKQYTADAAVTLILVGLAAWTEAGWSRRRLGTIVAVVAVGTLISNVTVIAAVCVFGGLVLVAAAYRQWRRFAEAIVAGLAAGLIAAVAMFGIAARGRTQALQDFWADYFPSLGNLPHYLWHQVSGLFPLLGAQRPPQALMLGVFCVLGVVTVARCGRPSAAAAIVLLPLAAIVLGLTRTYPLLDLRTSHFLLVATGAVAGLGVAGTAVWASTFVRRTRQQTLVAAVITVVVLGAFAADNSRWYRLAGDKPGIDYRSPIASEDSRSAAAYVASHRGPNDVIVVSVMGRYGFGFYWRQDPIELVTPYSNAINWSVDFPTQPSIVAMDSDTAEGIRNELNQAIDLAARRGPDARVWLVRSHLQPAEEQAWRQALVYFNVEPVTQSVEPVALITKK
jgi:hypothetical protein